MRSKSEQAEPKAEGVREPIWSIKGKAIIHRSGRVVKTGKAWEHSSRERHRVDIGRAGPTTTLNMVERSCLQQLKSPLAAKHSNLANWTTNWLKTSRIGYGALPPLHPPRIHLTSLRWLMLPDLLSFCCSSTPLYYCQRKPKSKKKKKQDRSGNEARYHQHSHIMALGPFSTGLPKIPVLSLRDTDDVIRAIKHAIRSIK